MRRITPRWATAASAMAMALALGACTESSVTAPVTTRPLLNTGSSSPGLVQVCKAASAPAGTYNFTVSQAGGRGGNLPAGSSFTLTPGACTDVWQALPDPPSSDPLVTVTVTEVNLPSGIQFDSVVVDAPLTPVYSGTGVSVQVNFYHGAIATFYNSQIPSVASEGCTPGYWKQPQHFDSWTAPYTPTTAFSSVFENAFPGKTLEGVLKLGGGGLNALGRHTVAALLNAAAGLNSGFTTTGVINAFNAVYPGSSADYEALKNSFAASNELACPLN